MSREGWELVNGDGNHSRLTRNSFGVDLQTLTHKLTDVTIDLSTAQAHLSANHKDVRALLMVVKELERAVAAVRELVTAHGL